MCAIIDNGDGTYTLQFCSNDSGESEVSVTIDDVPIQGVPATLRLGAGSPDIKKTLIYDAKGDLARAGGAPGAAGSIALLCHHDRDLVPSPQNAAPPPRQGKGDIQ